MISKPAPEQAADPLFDRLRVIDDPVGRSGPVNMALDEVLLQGVMGGLPLLRFYGWQVSTVSFGYFEPVADARRLAGDREVVRRLTGGGLVEHGQDLTYTLVVPRSHPFANLRSAATYQLIHAALRSALERAGVSAASHQGPTALVSTTDGNACFLRPVPHDLVANGGKVAGGAQRRTRAGLLHQGSIRLASTSEAAWSQTVRQVLPWVLARRCYWRDLEHGELTRAEVLAAAKYATAAWMDQR